MAAGRSPENLGKVRSLKLANPTDRPAPGAMTIPRARAIRDLASILIKTLQLAPQG